MPANGKHAGGRPTVYEPSYVTKVLGIIARSSSKNPLTIAGIAVELGHHKQTLYEWEEAHPEFGDVLKKVRETQEHQLVQNGLNSKWSTAMSIFLLKNNHGYTDKQEIDHSGDLALILHGRAQGADDRELVLSGLGRNGKNGKPKR